MGLPNQKPSIGNAPGASKQTLRRLSLCSLRSALLRASALLACSGVTPALLSLFGAQNCFEQAIISDLALFGSLRCPALGDRRPRGMEGSRGHSATFPARQKFGCRRLMQATPKTARWAIGIWDPTLVAQIVPGPAGALDSQIEHHLSLRPAQ